MGRQSFDEKCYELALAFLADEPGLNTDANADELAMMLQGEIEDWISLKKMGNL